MSVALKQFEAMIAERTQGLEAEQAVHVRDELMDNPVLTNYYSQEGKLFVTVGDRIVETLSCERVALEYPQRDPEDPSQWQHGMRGQANLARTRNGDLWAFMKSGPMFHCDDDGETWTWTPGSSGTSGDDFTFTILQDDSFLVVGGTEGQRSLVVHRSSDLGKTWEQIATIDPPPPYIVIDSDTPAMTQLLDGTILFTAECDAGKSWRELRGHHIFRSTDGGKSWTGDEVTWPANRVTPDGPDFPARSPGDSRHFTCESQILELASGKLLHTVRWHIWVDGMPWGHLGKTALFLDSEDGGLTWTNVRPALDADGQTVLEVGECHGWSAQLPDGRIVMVHDHRYPHPEGQAIAHVSDDEGKTWDQRAYHVSFGSGYPAVLALENGTIVTVSGAGLLDETGRARASRSLWSSVATRWTLPPEVGQ